MPIINEFLQDAIHGLPTSDTTFRMVIAYEDQFALSRAQRLQSQLTRRCQEEIEITGSAWNFSLLGHPQLRKKAASDAVAADMIVIAASGSELPHHVVAWVKNLLVQREENAGALVMLLDSTEDRGDKSGGAAVLREMAEMSGLDFFCNRDRHQPGECLPELNDYKSLAATQ